MIPLLKKMKRKEVKNQEKAKKRLLIRQLKGGKQRVKMMKIPEE